MSSLFLYIYLFRLWGGRLKNKHALRNKVNALLSLFGQDHCVILPFNKAYIFCRKEIRPYRDQTSLDQDKLGLRILDSKHIQLIEEHFGLKMRISDPLAFIKYIRSH